MKLKESWRHWTADQARSFLRTGPEGKHHLSRQTAVRLLRGMSSVLDVGCGTGVMFELIRDRRLQLDYLGIDVTEKFLEVTRNTSILSRRTMRRP
jgi:ubiquinone/menaquinone biosynthesis C-methylase UbiE